MSPESARDGMWRGRPPPASLQPENIRRLACWELYCGAIMDKALESRAVRTGYLTLTVPALATVVLVPLLGVRIFDTSLLLYYALAWMALAWQWYDIALPGWKSWLAAKGAHSDEVESLAERSHFAWPQKSVVGPFAFHTTAAIVCGIHLGPLLLSRWLAWALPLAGMSLGHAPTWDDYLQHFEVASILPALILGYILSLHWRKMATSAWILPTLVVAYQLIAFTEPQSSILAPHSSTRFAYFFVIQRSMPSLGSGFLGGDPVRVARQAAVIAPFYAGVAYSVASLAARHDVLRKFFGRSAGVDPELEKPIGEGSDSL